MLNASCILEFIFFVLNFLKVLFDLFSYFVCTYQFLFACEYFLSENTPTLYLTFKSQKIYAPTTRVYIWTQLTSNIMA